MDEVGGCWVLLIPSVGISFSRVSLVITRVLIVVFSFYFKIGLYLIKCLYIYIYITYIIIIFTRTAILDLLPPLSAPFMTCHHRLPPLIATATCHANLPQLATTYHHHTHPFSLTTINDLQQLQFIINNRPPTINISRFSQI